MSIANPPAHHGAAPVALAIVTGMHRAGTSAIARALAVLGFDLGPRLMSADPRMNARGFFEDIDVVALDDALLAHFGADWKSIALLADANFADPALGPQARAARTLLAERLAPTGRFACKDPRLPRVLPFWQAAIRDLGIAEGYVIAVRHPGAVIASLTARDGLDARRSAWLWLTHVVSSLAATQGRPRVVVDYDRLLAAPARELARVAAAFGLAPPAADDPALVDFRDHFLSAELRHAHVASDVVDPGWPPLVADAHALTVALAAAPGAIAANADASIADLWNRLRAWAPLLAYAGALERAADEVPRLAGELAWAKTAVAQAQGYAADLEAHLAAKEADLVAVRAHAGESSDAAAAYAQSLRAALDHAEGELAGARRALGTLGATRAGRGLLRWLGRARSHER